MKLVYFRNGSSTNLYFDKIEIKKKQKKSFTIIRLIFLKHIFKIDFLILFSISNPGKIFDRKFREKCEKKNRSRFIRRFGVYLDFFLANLFGEINREIFRSNILPGKV